MGSEQFSSADSKGSVPSLVTQGCSCSTTLAAEVFVS